MSVQKSLETYWMHHAYSIYNNFPTFGKKINWKDLKIQQF